MELPGHYRCSCIRLATADADRIVTLRDDWISILGHHAQIAILQIEMDLLARARFQMNALELAESDQGRTLHGRKLEIDLHNLISRELAGVGYRCIRTYMLPRCHRLRRNGE